MFCIYAENCGLMNFKPQCNQTKYFKSVFAGSLLSMHH